MIRLRREVEGSPLPHSDSLRVMQVGGALATGSPEFH